jgi:hypothetical protein
VCIAHQKFRLQTRFSSPQEKGRFCRLFSGLAKKNGWQFLSVHLDGGQASGSFELQASATPMDLVVNRHLLQPNSISSQSTENFKVYSACSSKTYHQMSRLHRMLTNKWKCYDASDCACPQVRTLITSSLNFPRLNGSKVSNCCLALSICGPVCPSKMLPSNNKNSSTI